ncbi:1778_t:CDS:2 [Cetraspora pellucida]|uniref:1778_t:CDS:1 n=1 Tax=Cetraspora pellucida TaxID=1433469 RepID=A0ACA9KRZ2_9GLOM|nr:1778_t:CDS:2 [Cetraspora pellucida]
MLLEPMFEVMKPTRTTPEPQKAHYEPEPNITISGNVNLCDLYVEETEKEDEETLNIYFEQKRCRRELIQQLNDEFYEKTIWAYQNRYFSEPEVSSNKYSKVNIAEDYAHNFHLGHDECWWNINIEEEMFYGITIDSENQEWLLPLDDDAEMNWE